LGVLVAGTGSGAFGGGGFSEAVASEAALVADGESGVWAAVRRVAGMKVAAVGESRGEVGEVTASAAMVV
jgi:hypothetical protein